MTPDEIIEVLQGLKAGRGWQFLSTANEWKTPILSSLDSMLHALYSGQTIRLAPLPEETDAIESKLSRSKWVKVADGLPVVPEGKFSVRIWAFRADKGKVFRANWWQHYGFQKINFTHWQYRQDDTPAPPEDA